MTHTTPTQYNTAHHYTRAVSSPRTFQIQACQAHQLLQMWAQSRHALCTKPVV